MGRDILVDGYNVIKNSPSFQAVEARNLAGARTLLITQLVNRYRHTPHQVIVVFDGNDIHEQISHDRRIRIIYSRYGETADSVIARLAAEARVAGREVEMYSNDYEVQQAVSQQGGSIYTTSQLTHQLNAAPLMLHGVLSTVWLCAVNMALIVPTIPMMSRHLSTLRAERRKSHPVATSKGTK